MILGYLLLKPDRDCRHAKGRSHPKPYGLQNSCCARALFTLPIEVSLGRGALPSQILAGHVIGERGSAQGMACIEDKVQAIVPPAPVSQALVTNSGLCRELNPWCAGRVARLVYTLYLQSTHSVCDCVLATRYKQTYIRGARMHRRRKVSCIWFRSYASKLRIAVFQSLERACQATLSEHQRYTHEVRHVVTHCRDPLGMRLQTLTDYPMKGCSPYLSVRLI